MASAGIYRDHLCWVKKNRVQGVYNASARPFNDDDPYKIVTTYGYNKENAIARLHGEIDKKLDGHYA